MNEYEGGERPPISDVVSGSFPRERISNIFFGSPNATWEAIVIAYLQHRATGNMPVQLDKKDKEIILKEIRDRSF